MKAFKSVHVFSNGSFTVQFNSTKKSNKPIFKKIDDKNFKFNQKKINNNNAFLQSTNYKKKYNKL
jgi:hypothetical protein